MFRAFRRPDSHRRPFSGRPLRRARLQNSELLESRQLLSAIALFDDPNYVDTDNNSATENEPDNLRAVLESLGHTVTTFNGITATDFTDALEGNEVLVFPELEVAPLAPDLSSSAVAVIRAFAAQGGGVIVTGGGGERVAPLANDLEPGINLVNAITGLSLLGDLVFTPSTLHTADALGTAFEGGPNSIPANEEVVGVLASTTTSQVRNLYFTSPLAPEQIGDNDLVTVLAVPLGCGEVAFLGWDWFNSDPPNDAGQDGGWNDVLSRAVIEVTTPGPDRFEAPGGGNDTRSSATVLGSEPVVTLQDLSIDNGDDHDFFRITAHDTGKLIVNALFEDDLGDLDLRLSDSRGNVIALSAGTEDNERIILPVVAQEVYFLEVFGSAGATNCYQLEIENFAAPVPSTPRLDPASDSGMMSDDGVTRDTTPRILISADLADFAAMGIPILSAADAVGNNDGAAVFVSIVNIASGDTVEGFADPLGASNTLFEFTPAALPSGSTLLVRAAVQINDLRTANGGGAQDPARGRAQLSETLLLTIDTDAPNADVPLDLITASDSGTSNDDEVTSTMQPALQGFGPAYSKVRLLAARLISDGAGGFVFGASGQVGESVATGPLGENQPLGLWEITSEPLVDGTYRFTVLFEDLAGNLGTAQTEVAPEQFQQLVLDVVIDGEKPNTPVLDLLAASDTGLSQLDNITSDATPDVRSVSSDPIPAGDAAAAHFVKYRIWDRYTDPRDAITNVTEVLLVDGNTLQDPADAASDFLDTLGPLAAGVHNLKLEFEDVAGNLSDDFLLTVVVDDAAPLAPTVPDLLASSDSGMMMDDDVTNKMQPAFSGTAEVNTKVRIYARKAGTEVDLLVGEGIVGSDATAPPPDDGLGLWEVTVEPLIDGSYEIRAQVEDAAGQLSPLSDPLPIVIDTEKPNTPVLDLFDADTGLTDQDNITRDNTPSVRSTSRDPIPAGDAADAHFVKYRIWDRFTDPNTGVTNSPEVLLVDGNVPQDATAAGSDFLDTLPLLADGVHNLKLEFEDVAGNLSDDYLLPVVVDTLAPAVRAVDLLASSDSGMFMDDNITNKMQPAFTSAAVVDGAAGGTGEANAIVKVFAAKRIADPLNAGQFIFDAPQLVGVGQVNSDLTDGQEGNGLGIWEVTVEPLIDGTYQITCRFEDVAGNFSDAGTPLEIVVDTEKPNTPALDLLEASDSGRSNVDDITNDTTPTMKSTSEDPIPAGDADAAHFVKYRIFDRFQTNNEALLVNQTTLIDPTPAAPAADADLVDDLPALADGVHNLKLEFEDVAGNLSDDFLLPVIVDTVAPPVTFGLAPSTIDGLAPESDTGVPSQPTTFTDRITSEQTPTFFGTAEADAIVRLFANGAANLAGLSVAVPEDGNLAFPQGQWRIASTLNLNANPPFASLDGLRTMTVTAEDVAGNVNLSDDGVADNAQQTLDIFLDTQGPQVTNVQITSDPNFDLFDPKPSAGPTPLVRSLTISLRDLPNRVAGFLYNVLAENGVSGDPVEAPGNITLVGDHSGLVAITSITFNPVAPVAGAPATGTIVIDFARPLPDDRFTLTVSDQLVDVAGNRLDGESNAAQPLETPTFPSGDEQPGGDFVARFTVDSRPEIGTYAAGSIFLDINGNLLYDPEGEDNDATNRDLIFTMGVEDGGGDIGAGGFQIHDGLFAGNFASSGEASADGFDKLAAYGNIAGSFRWLVDTNNDGKISPALGDHITTQSGALAVNGLPFAGNWDGNAANGDEVGLFDGTRFLLDSNHNFVIDAADRIVVTALRGTPLAGDFDGDGHDDLATLHENEFFFDLTGGADGGFNGTVDHQFVLGFPGVQELPLAADMDQDGIDDVGLWVPRRSGTVDSQQSEWYFLLSNDLVDGLDPRPAQVRSLSGTLDHAFSPFPLGQDLFIRYGDDFAIPIVGNFDPPVARSGIAQLPNVELGLVHGAQELSNLTVTNQRLFRFEPSRDGQTIATVNYDPGNSDVRVTLVDTANHLLGEATGQAGAAALNAAVQGGATYFIRVAGVSGAVDVSMGNQVQLSDLLDVSRDGVVTPLDALMVIDSINSGGSRQLSRGALASSLVYLDTNMDGNLAPLDALRVIDLINARTSTGLAATALDESGSGAAELAGLAAVEAVESVFDDFAEQPDEQPPVEIDEPEVDELAVAMAEAAGNALPEDLALAEEEADAEDSAAEAGWDWV